MAKESTAQFYDRLVGRTTFGLFLLSLAILIDCIGYFVEPATADMLWYGRKALTVAIVFVVAPNVFKLVMLRLKDKAACREPESFIVQVYQKASTHGFTFVMLTLVVLHGVFVNIEPTLPVQFFIKALLSATLMVTSISFYLQTRVDDEDDDFDGAFDDEASS